MNRTLLTLISLLVLTIFHSASAQKKRFLTVMTYNVENLFDTTHDVYKLPNGKILEKQDYAYLPLALKQGAMKAKIDLECGKIDPKKKFYFRRECFNKDWSNEVYKIKLRNLSKAIRYNTVNKCGADIIYLSEVENVRAVGHLKQALPKHCGYKHYGLIEGPDSRGIDIGFISRFPPVKHRLIDYPLQPNDKKRRSLYQATFNVYGKSVTIIGNHWPSQATKAMSSRMIPAKLLTDAISKSKSDLILAVGDFNTSEKKEAPIFHHLRNYVVDAVELRGAQNINKPGSHFYRGHWAFLDRIFVAKKTATTKSAFIPMWNTFYAINKGIVWTKDVKGKNGKVKYRKGTPHRFSDYFKQGYSDHLPLIMSFQLR